VTVQINSVCRNGFKITSLQLTKMRQTTWPAQSQPCSIVIQIPSQSEPIGSFHANLQMHYKFMFTW